MHFLHECQMLWFLQIFYVCQVHVREYDISSQGTAFAIFLDVISLFRVILQPSVACRPHFMIRTLIIRSGDGEPRMNIRGNT